MRKSLVRIMEEALLAAAVSTWGSLVPRFVTGALLVTSLIGSLNAAENARIVLTDFKDISAWVAESAFDAPEAGFYRFVVDGSRAKGRPTKIAVNLDDELFYFADQGGKDRKCDADGRLVENVYLTKGGHKLEIRGHQIWYHWEAVRNMLAKTTLSFERITDPAATLTVREVGQTSMVFEKNEPLKLRLEQATTAAATYTVVVSPQRGDAKTHEWKAMVSLPAEQARAVADVAYPCAQEGAFEYRVLDAAGKVVHGPWAFVVVDSTPAPLPKARQLLVDSVDCAKADDPEHHFRDNGTSQVMSSPSGSYRVTGSARLHSVGYVPDEGFAKEKHGPYRRAKDGEKATLKGFSACDWFAYSLKVKNPGRAHLVTVRAPTDARRVTALAAIDPVTTYRNCAVLELGDAPRADKLAEFSIPVWPNTDYIDILIGNFAPQGADFNTQGAVAAIELYEFPEGLPALAEAAQGWDVGNEFGYYIEQRDLGTERFTMAKYWTGDEMIPRILGPQDGRAYDWRALYDSWTRLAEYARFMGDNYVMYGAHTYSMELFRTNLKEGGYDVYARGWGWRLADRYERDTLLMILKIFSQHRLKIVLDMINQRVTDKDVTLLDPQGVYPHENIMLTDLSGSIQVNPATFCGELNPAHPLARRYLVAFYEEIAARFGGYDSFGGINIRQDGWGNAMSGWFISDRVGYDDFTTRLFATEHNVELPAFDPKDPERFKKHREWLKANAWDAWMAWRNDKVESLLAEISAAVRRHAPEARIYCGGSFDTGGGLSRERLEGNRALGFERQVDLGGGQHVEVNGLDPVCFNKLDISPAAIDAPRQINDLNRFWSYQESIVTGKGCSIRPYPYDLRKASDALAEQSIDRIRYGGMWIPPALSKGRRQLAQAWRAIPKANYEKPVEAQSPDGLVACWQARRGNRFDFYLVNRSAVAQTVTVELRGAAKETLDLVSGKTFDGKIFEAEIEPYMLRVFSAPGTLAVAAVKAQPNRDYLSDIEAQVLFLEEMARKAPGVVYTAPNLGGEFILSQYAPKASGVWQKKDLAVSAEALVQPISQAWSEKRHLDVDRALEGVYRDQSWWFEAYGWPVGHYVHAQPEGTFATPELLAAALTSEKVAPQAFPGVPGKALVFPNRQTKLKVKADVTAGYDLLLWMLAGGEHGPVTVSLGGKVIGKVSVSGGKPGYGRFRSPKPLILPAGDLDLTLEGSGGGPLVLQAVELAPAEPTSLKRWQAIGLFDKASKRTTYATAVGLDTVFGPEANPGTVDLAAEYSGMNGKPARWREIDMGEDKFLQLLERFFPYEYKQGNGVAILATWVRSPEQRQATLYYSVDWYAKLWVNGALVKDINGPWGKFATLPIELKPGWNMILIKTSTGTDGWKANFAISDPGDLEYSATPPKQ